MAEAKVLITGFTNADTKSQGEGEKTCPTITLIRDGSMRIICDPGVAEQGKIISALEKEGIKAGDITHVFITHSHLDHYRNIGMFPQAKTIEYWGVWDGGKCDPYPEQFTENIKIVKTPGHNFDALTMFVKTGQGIVAICGDVFWKENSPEIDAYASDQKQLAESRKLVLENCDWVVPGHGEMYKAI